MGKTAVLVQLTKMLAEHRAVPVPVRLRDVVTELDFGDAARKQFCKEVDPGTLPEGHTDKVWRQLRRDDKIVVLADGLEEAFPEGNENEKDRDNLIRRAIQQAAEQKLPLVIASRPHHPLEATTAAIMELEPLSEEAALDYIEQDSGIQDSRRLDWIIETASVADAPLYLQITRQLYTKGLLEHLTADRDRRSLDTREVDRSALRWRLLDAWGRGLADGHLRSEIPLEHKDRVGTIKVVSALACVGLLKDTLEVRFEDLIGKIGTDEYQASESQAEPERAQSIPASHDIWKRVKGEVWEALSNSDITNKKSADPRRYLWLVSLAATRADQLGIVEAYGNRVRFPHSIMQAYLGCQFLDTVLGQGKVLDKVLEEPGPGRELLIALCLYSRAKVCQCASNTSEKAEQAGRPVPKSSVSPAGPDAETPPAAAITTAAVTVPGETALAKPSSAVIAVPSCAACESSNALTKTLRKAAERHNDAKAFDIYAAALEIDSIQKAPLQRTIAESLRGHWGAMTGDRRTLEEAKLGLVLRFGEALREVVRRDHYRPAYNELFDIGCVAESYPVRLAIAQEIGSGADEGFTALCRGLRDPLVVYRAKMRKPAGNAPNGRPGGVSSAGVTEAGTRPQTPQGVEDVSQAEKARHSGREEKNTARARIWREFVLRAWMTPMLAGSVTDACRDDAQWHLEAWLKHLKPALRSY